MNIVHLQPPSAVDWPRSAVTIGNFDGVHLGHRRMIEGTRRAEAADRQSVVLTFDPHPSKVLRSEDAVPLLMTADQKRRALEALGVQKMAVLAFDRAVADLTPERFVDDVLVAALKASTVVVGEAFRFGRARSAGTDELRRLGAARGFGVLSVPPVLDGDRPVSSSRIREAVGAGDVETAGRLLGHEFELIGTVVRGDGRGRTIGVPTANLDPLTEVTPAAGVYAAWLSSPSVGSNLAAVVNIGTRPTFDGRTTTIEAHVLDHNGDFYGERAALQFVSRVRDERRFANAGELVAQIQDDIRTARVNLERRGTAKI